MCELNFVLDEMNVYDMLIVVLVGIWEFMWGLDLNVVFDEGVISGFLW